jgi:hypothetical protein
MHLPPFTHSPGIIQLEKALCAPNPAEIIQRDNPSPLYSALPIPSCRNHNEVFVSPELLTNPGLPHVALQ